jgi:hypothetical protein
VAKSEHAYLALPETVSMVEGHCFIIPDGHVRNTLELEEYEWEECRNYMKSLVRFFAAQNRGVLFFELVSGRSSHAMIECIPVPAEVYEQAPAYLKEAILSTRFLFFFLTT